jgi:hypothetical protein
MPKLDLTDEESQLRNNLGISDDVSLGIPPSEIRPTRNSSSGSPKTPVRGATSKTSNTERVGSPKTPIWADDDNDVGIRGERIIKTVTTEDIMDLTSMTSRLYRIVAIHHIIIIHFLQQGCSRQKYFTNLPVDFVRGTSPLLFPTLV